MTAPDSAAALASCDPLVAPTADIELGSVLGAGQDSTGTIYVIDKSQDELRAFISADGELYRQRVSGSGESSGDVAVTTLSLGEVDAPVTLQLEVSSDGTQRMGVFRGELKTKTITIGEQGEELTLLGADDVRALAVHNYANDIIVEYRATLSDGRLLVVLRPRDFKDFLEFRVFFGTLERLDERQLTSAERALDGGSTFLEFDVDGQLASADFPVGFVDDQFTPGPPTLTLGKTKFDMTLDTPASPEGASYYCRAP